MTIAELIKELPNSLQPQARAWLPTLRRWAKNDMDGVEKWLFHYQYKQESWYQQLLRKMTVAEKRREGKRRRAQLIRYKESRIGYIKFERKFLQQIVRILIPILIKSL